MLDHGLTSGYVPRHSLAYLRYLYRASSVALFAFHSSQRKCYVPRYAQQWLCHSSRVRREGCGGCNCSLPSSLAVLGLCCVRWQPQYAVSIPGNTCIATSVRNTV